MTEELERLPLLEVPSYDWLLRQRSPLDRWRVHSLREAWPTLSLSQRQAIITALMEITITPCATAPESSMSCGW